MMQWFQPNDALHYYDNGSWPVRYGGKIGAERIEVELSELRRPALLAPAVHFHHKWKILK